jgi:hypothetical protein
MQKGKKGQYGAINPSGPETVVAISNFQANACTAYQTAAGRGTRQPTLGHIGLECPTVTSVYRR